MRKRITTAKECDDLPVGSILRYTEESNNPLSNFCSPIWIKAKNKKWLATHEGDLLFIKENEGYADNLISAFTVLDWYLTDEVSPKLLKQIALLKGELISEYCTICKRYANRTFV